MALTVRGALVVVSGYGLRLALAGFPWKPTFLVLGACKTELLRGPTSEDGLGWPFDYLAPKRSPVGISLGNGVMISLLCGWWLHVLADDIARTHGPRDMVAFFYTTAIAGGTFVRVVSWSCLAHTAGVSRATHWNY